MSVRLATNLMMPLRGVRRISFAIRLSAVDVRAVNADGIRTLCPLYIQAVVGR